MAERHTTQSIRGGLRSDFLRQRFFAFTPGLTARGPSRQATPDRVCPCGNRLSRYNLGILCYCCEHQLFETFEKEY